MNPELSCIIITLNEEENLPIILNCLKNQTFKDFEIIVADYNSTDNTRKIAKDYDCKIVDGGTHSVARNNGARVSMGEYLLFLDADCFIEENFIEKNLNKFKESKNGTSTVRIKPLYGNVLHWFMFLLYHVWVLIIYRVSPHCSGCSVFTKKSVFNEINGFDESIKFAEDHDYARRGKKYGFGILPVGIYTSVRRIRKDGKIKFISKYAYAGIYRLFYKEIDKELFSYDSNYLKIPNAS